MTCVTRDELLLKVLLAIVEALQAHRRQLRARARNEQREPDTQIVGRAHQAGPPGAPTRRTSPQPGETAETIATPMAIAAVLALAMRSTRGRS